MNLFRRTTGKEFFTADEHSRIVEAIRDAEQRTSGEVRVYLERRCKYMEPLDRAAELFWNLKMDHTKDKNAVLIYVATRDHQFAIYADRGIHEKVGNEFWQAEVKKMGFHFSQHHYADALLEVIKDVGQALTFHFPFDRQTDKNELPDDIVFGR
jgi:uncharacterized membrane protein